MFDEIVGQPGESDLRLARMLRIVITEGINDRIGDPTVALRFYRRRAVGKGSLDVLHYGGPVF